MSNRLLSSLNLPPLILAQLQQSHYNTVADVLELSLTQLANDIHVRNEDANYIQNLIENQISIQQISTSLSSSSPGHADNHEFTSLLTKCTGIHTSVSALELLRQDMHTIPLTTNCSQLEDILGGGFYPHTVNEIVGAPGIGKSQLMMQLCCTIQLPKILGGLESKAIYIDTEGSIMSERFQEISTSFIQQLRDQCTHSSSGTTPPYTDEQHTAVNLLTNKFLLNNVKYLRIYDHIELIACIQWLSLYLEDHRDIRLVVIDSIAFHFRSGFSNTALNIQPSYQQQPNKSNINNTGRQYNVRNKLLASIGNDLQRLAKEKDCIVVTTNHMTTKFIPSKDSRNKDTHASLQPALGESWGAIPSTRVLLEWQGNKRVATVKKSSHRRVQSHITSAVYDITERGIVNASP